MIQFRPCISLSAYIPLRLSTPRLAVARVLLKDPEILFFDEAVRSSHPPRTRDTSSSQDSRSLSQNRQTSALDSTTEQELMAEINAMLETKKRTSVFIAHRLRTVSDAGTSRTSWLLISPVLGSSSHPSAEFVLLASTSLSDLIIVLDKGAVAEQGTHEELLAKGGLYAELWAASLDQQVPAEVPNRVEEGGKTEGKA
jgi:ATP-binding cassette subfamily B (MDR/TAP) protein 7